MNFASVFVENSPNPVENVAKAALACGKRRSTLMMRLRLFVRDFDQSGLCHYHTAIHIHHLPGDVGSSRVGGQKAN